MPYMDKTTYHAFHSVYWADKHRAWTLCGWVTNRGLTATDWNKVNCADCNQTRAWLQRRERLDEWKRGLDSE